MSTSSPTIPPDIAAHVLFMFDRSGVVAQIVAADLVPTEFQRHLIRAIAHADCDTRDQLQEIFPEYVTAVAALKYDPDGMDRLKEIAALRCARCTGDDGPFTDLGMCEACARPMPLDGVA
ncbi:hypothetical protein [Streptomyces sp. NPDC047990]|uniref:hypothetical protein n=1 Tax=Streptomyces sp. NPDC047990 TaxID=3365496 RepID=UPI003712FF1B